MSYDPNFLGIRLPLPVVRPQRSGNILRRDILTDGILAEYPNYGVVTDTAKRSPVFAVQMIDQTKFQTAGRSDRWKLDSRIGMEYQLDNAYYTNNPWDRGHMAHRESAGWGNTKQEAQKASDETFYYSNACLQHECVNQDEWLALEDWVQKLDQVQDGKLVVFTGPIFGDFSRTVRPDGREPAEVPAAFFKIICYKSVRSDSLEVRAFVVQQDNESMRDKKGRTTFNFQKYQVTIREIEELTGLDFPDDVYEKNPLFYYDRDEARQLGVTVFPERVDVDLPKDIVATGHRRSRVLDDEIQVYIAAAQVNQAKKWVSILNLDNDTVDLAGWSLTDRNGNTVMLSGSLEPGEAKTFHGSKTLDPVKLPDNGGLLILKNVAGEQVDRIEYTEKDIKRWEKIGGAGKPIFFVTYRKNTE